MDVIDVFSISARLVGCHMNPSCKESYPATSASPMLVGTKRFSPTFFAYPRSPTTLSMCCACVASVPMPFFSISVNKSTSESICGFTVSESRRFLATAGTALRLQTLEALLGQSSYRNKDLIEARPVGISGLAVYP